jgi:hypothetical protein
MEDNTSFFLLFLVQNGEQGKHSPAYIRPTELGSKIIPSPAPEDEPTASLTNSPTSILLILKGSILQCYISSTVRNGKPDYTK